MALVTPHALRIPEIVRMIFDFAGPAVNAVNTQVCKLWFDIALDVLWEEVDNLPRLLRILSPLKCDIHSRYYHFEHPPSENDWKRFEKYAIRVRRLKYSFHYPKLGDKSFEMLNQTKIRAGILPNLRALEWNLHEKTQRMNLFMHNGIQKLVVYLQRGIPPHVFFEDVLARMPDLAILDIDSDGPVQVIEEELVHLLQGLHKLERVVLPCFYFTTKIAECLSHAQYLTSINYHIENPQDMDDMGVTSFNPTLTEGAFPLLCELSISTNFEETARFVKTPFSPKNLTQFYNETYVVDMPDSIHRLLSALSENYQSLREVELLSNLDPTDLTYPPRGCITLNTLKPIFKLPHLVTFNLQHPHPLVMTQQDIQCLASSCPALENLDLGVSSLYLTESALTLTALVPLAQHCLKLEYLGLFMDATAAKVPEISLAAAPGSFRSLQYLCVGYSIIDEWMAPTVYLSHLLAPDCEIQARAPWDEDNVGPELDNIIDERANMWEKVSTTVPALSKVRAQERRRMRAILEDLSVDVATMDPTAVCVKLESLSTALT